MISPGIGDVVAVRESSFASIMIRFGAALRNKPNLSNHIAVMHHTVNNPDGSTTLWGIEGKPGGVGWVDMTVYLNSRWTRTNVEQPKTDEQRKLVASVMESMLGRAYDWAAIAADAFEALHLPYMFGEHWSKSGSPGHVVCSSVAAYSYGQAKLLHPNLNDERRCMPADWDEFIITRSWE